MGALGGFKGMAEEVSGSLGIPLISVKSGLGFNLGSEIYLAYTGRMIKQKLVFFLYCYLQSSVLLAMRKTIRLDLEKLGGSRTEYCCLNLCNSPRL